MGDPPPEVSHSASRAESPTASGDIPNCECVGVSCGAPECGAYYSAIVARIAAALIATVVLALGVVAGGSSATRVRDLEAWARFTWNPTVGVTTDGYGHFPLRVTKHVPPGMYRIAILATETFGFQLIGPGINRRTKTCLERPGSVPCSQKSFIPANTSSWKVRLSRGTYRYRAVGPDAVGLRSPTSGSFKVP